MSVSQFGWSLLFAESREEASQGGRCGRGQKELDITIKSLKWAGSPRADPNRSAPMLEAHNTPSGEDFRQRSSS